MKKQTWMINDMLGMYINNEKWELDG